MVIRVRIPARGPAGLIPRRTARARAQKSRGASRAGELEPSQTAGRCLHGRGGVLEDLKTTRSRPHGRRRRASNSRWARRSRMSTSITAAPHGVRSKGTTTRTELLHHDFVDLYHVIIFTHLTLRGDEDLIYSSKTLQHFSPDAVTSLHKVGAGWLHWLHPISLRSEMGEPGISSFLPPASKCAAHDHPFEALASWRAIFQAEPLAAISGRSIGGFLSGAVARAAARGGDGRPGS